MPGWLRDVASLALGSVVTAIILALLHRRGIVRREAQLRQGRPVSFEAFLRGTAAPYPRRWRYGWVDVGYGAPDWRPRFSLRRDRIALPASASVAGIRRPKNLREMIATNPDFLIVKVKSESGDLELAIRDRDLPTSLRGLETQTGGAWRLGDAAHLE